MLHHQIFQQINHHSNMHYAIYLMDKDYHKIWTLYDFMQENTIIFLPTKSLFWQITKVGFGEEKNFAGPSTFPRHEGPHCQGGQRGGVYTEQVNITQFPQKILIPQYLQNISMIFSQYPEHLQDASGRRVEALRVRDVVHVQPERPARGGADVRSPDFRCKEARCRVGRWGYKKTFLWSSWSSWSSWAGRLVDKLGSILSHPHGAWSSQVISTLGGGHTMW